MLLLNGIYTEKSKLPVNHFIGTLLFTEYPTTLIYADEEENPIIKEWVDCSDDGKINKHFYFKTSKFWLNKFINGGISHKEFIFKAIDGLAYFQDETDEQTSNHIVISVKIIPKEYLPSNKFIFNSEDAVDLDKINNYFKLNEVPDAEDVFSKVKEFAIERNSETFNLHFEKGSGIGYGTINTEIIGKTLSQFDKFYKEAALDTIIGSKRGSTKKEKLKELSPFISTQVFGNIAASYSILIRPIDPQYEVDNTTKTELIASNIFRLFGNSSTLENLKEEYTLHSEYTINSYESFLRNIYELGVTLKLDWYNPVRNSELNEHFDIKSSNSIINNIKNLNMQEEEDFLKTGKFRAINCDTGHYTFVSNEEEQFTGYFDELIAKGSEQISFLEIYDIKIHRVMVKEAGRTDAKITDYIVAFYEKES